MFECDDFGGVGKNSTVLHSEHARSLWTLSFIHLYFYITTYKHKKLFLPIIHTVLCVLQFNSTDLYYCAFTTVITHPSSQRLCDRYTNTVTCHHTNDNASRDQLRLFAILTNWFCVPTVVLIYVSIRFDLQPLYL